MYHTQYTDKHEMKPYDFLTAREKYFSLHFISLLGK